jgi:ketosteroid isomerase-like protein
MRRLCSLLSLLLLTALPLRAQSVEEEVRVADTARVLSTLRGDADRLGRLLSDHLIYCHISGKVQTKEVLLAAVRTNRIKYEAYDYREKNIVRLSDDLALLTGQVHLKASAGKEHVEFEIRILAVWRREDGGWRLLAYQSTKLDDPIVVSAAK